MKTEPQYIEGPKALENFERLATTVFRAPKPAITKHPKKNISSRKPKKSDRD